MKAKYWLIGGISSIAFAYFLNRSYQSLLSKNFSTESFDFATAQSYEFWITTFSSLGWITLIIGAILVVLQKSPRSWHRWYRLAAAGFLFSVVWSIVGVYVQTFTGDVLFWLGYQKPSNANYSKLEQLFQANNWKEADELTSEIIRYVSGTQINNDRLDATIASIKRLPCADFQAIDRLWVKYSNDRFGFSVQRRIFENINVPEGNAEYDLLDRMDMFLKQVKWDSRNDSKFSPEDAIGSLPSSGILLSSPFSSIQLFSIDESVKRQKWCRF